MKNSSRNSEPITWRAFICGIILIPTNAYWIMASWGHGGYATGQSFATSLSLYFNVIFIIVVLAALNLLVFKFTRRWTLNNAEISMLYIMLAIASSVAGHDMMEILMPILPHAAWFASAENEWAELFHKYVPQWLAIKERSKLVDYYRGESTFYMWEHVSLWLTPVLWWTVFIVVLVSILLCFNLLLRKQWIEHEKLSYPIIQLPLELTNNDFAGHLFRNRLMWMGFIGAGGIDVINGLHFLYPTVPTLGGRLYDIGPLFTEKPWNAIGWTPVAVYPFIIGLSFFIPLDLSFSCWFFYLFWKVQRILSAVLGLRSLPRFPYIDEQGFGGYMGICAIALYLSRRHLKQVWKSIVTGGLGLRNAQEPVSYRVALAGILLGMGFITFFCLRAGMSLGVVWAFFGIYFAISIAIARMRAELGPPVHDLHFASSPEFLVNALGTRKLGGANLTIFSYLFFFNRAHRSHPIPHQLEGFKMAESRQINNSTLLWAMTFAAIFGTIASAWAFLHLAYQYGTFGDQWVSWYSFNRLQSWLSVPRGADYPALIASCVGFLTAIALFGLRMRFVWWIFHPAGYAISGSWSMNPFWFSIFLSSIIKWVVLRHGGLKAHRKAIPLFMGLILGEFVVGSIWSILGIIVGQPMYRFLY
ncbi:TPA: hypothetical protein EYN09_15000 [Candidatus Poribacteria bacterium]|nr:hypothetical protein [Candidatus Poribacteria bacterium]